MITSMPTVTAKTAESDEIARQTAEYLAQGRKVAEIPFGVGHNTTDTYRAYQGQLAKMNAAEKVAKEAGLK